MDAVSSGGQLVFTQGRDAIDVHLHGQTLWLTQLQMARLFDTTVDNVSLHLKNIFQDHELDETATTEDFSIVRQEGKRQVKRHLKHYNLDAIISVGYRVSSVRATQFRIWATGVLRQHLTDGFTLNQRRLLERGIALEDVLALLSQTLVNQQLVSREGKEVLRVIRDYARTWYLLQRCGAFWCYLRLNQHLLAKPVEHLVNDNTLVALTLLLAESAPRQKDLMVGLVEHLLQENDSAPPP